MQLNPSITSGEKLSTCPVEKPEIKLNKNPKQILRETSRKLRESYVPNPRNEEQLAEIKEQLEALFSSTKLKEIPARSNSKTNQYISK